VRKFTVYALLVTLMAGALMMSTARVSGSTTAPFVVSSTKSLSVAGLSHVVTLPIGFSKNDFIVSCIDFNAATGGITIPTGWEVISYNAQTLEGACYYHLVALSTESATATWTTANLVAWAHVTSLIRGADPSRIPISTKQAAAGTSSSPAPPSLNPPSNSLILIGLIWGSSSFATLSSGSSGYTTIDTQNNDGTTSANAHMSYKVSVIGTDSPGTATLSSSARWVAATFAFIPVASGPLSGGFTANPDDGTYNLAVSFVSYVYGGESPYTYAWTFGDGSTSASANPSHTYTAAGMFIIYMAITDSAGSMITTSHTVQVDPQVPLAVIATANPNDGVVYLGVFFTTNVVGGVPAYVYAWTFGDGSTSASANPSHTYTIPGTYTARVVIYDSASPVAYTSASLQIVARPTPPLRAFIAASPNGGLSPLTTTFTANVSGGVPGYNYTWFFGDGTSAGYSQTVTHLYSSPGLYIVTLIVRDSAVVPEYTSESSSLTISMMNPSPIGILVLFLLGALWLAGLVAGTALRKGLFAILGGVSGLAFAFTVWETTGGELFSSTLLLAAAILTLAWVPFMSDKEEPLQ